MAISVGYYDFLQGGGVEAQRAVVEGLGYDPIFLSNPDFIHNADLMFVDVPKGSTADLTFALNAFMIGASAGKVLFLTDETASQGLVPDAASHGADEIDFVADGGPLAQGAGGVLTDASLDDYGVSNTAYLRVDSVDDSEFAVLATRDDPTRAVITLQSAGEGWIINSSVAMTDPLAAGDAPMTALAANALDYAAHLFAMHDVGLSGGDDVFSGGKGDDEVFGQDGADRIRGLLGDDIVHAGAGADTIVGGAGNDIVWGDNGDDLLRGSHGSDQVWGGEGSDSVNGGAGDDFLTGGAADDVLFGVAGADTLIGGAGDDDLRAGAGDDVLAGGLGQDVLFGGDGADRFMVDVADQGFVDMVGDFAHGSDVFDLSGLGPGLAFAAGGAFSHVQGEILLVDSGHGTLVRIDLDGDATSDLSIDVTTLGHAQLTSGDFVL